MRVFIAARGRRKDLDSEAIPNSNHGMVPSVVVLGGGPAGSTFAALLAQRGWKPILFTDGKIPDLLVGESLIPAVVPLLRELGIEERVAEVSQFKPGVSFVHPKAEHDMDFCFESVRDILPTYAYNVPRPTFDQLLADRASELGVTKVPTRASIEPDGNGGIRLSDDSLAAAPMLQGRQPDWIIDATGRSRLVARTLQIAAREGPRKDVAYFAHFQGCQHPKAEGQVIISRLESGWAWRIPLQKRMSIGVVLDQNTARSLGDSPETRLNAALERDPCTSQSMENAQRITGVKTYTNYQLISEQGSGPGWAQLGDAFGFVDPMLSPGLFLAMESARLLADRFTCSGSPTGPTPSELASYGKQMDQWLKAWADLIEMFYDGRIFSLQEAGQQILQQRSNRITRGIRSHLHRQIACMAAGAWTTRAYSRQVLRLSSKYLIWGVTPPHEMAIN